MIDGAFMTPGLHFHDSDTPLTNGQFERRGGPGRPLQARRSSVMRPTAPDPDPNPRPGARPR